MKKLQYAKRLSLVETDFTSNYCTRGMNMGIPRPPTASVAGKEQVWERAALL